MLKPKLEWIDVLLMLFFGCGVGVIAVLIFAVVYEPRWNRLEDEMITLRKMMTELNAKFEAFEDNIVLNNLR